MAMPGDLDRGKQPILNIVGELVALGPLRKDLLPLYAQWINDPHNSRMLGGNFPMTMEQEEKWYESASVSENSVSFTIYEKEMLRPIGTAGLGGIDHRNRAAEFGIMVGEPDARNRGYGTETTRLVLAYAFDTLGLHNVMLRAFEYNPGAVRAYQKAGFKEFGRRRQSRVSEGQTWDEVFMECLSSELRQAEQ
jgi:RimJ/RimL family protein N-acetyltransferase